jgi:DNA polymerase-4
MLYVNPRSPQHLVTVKRSEADQSVGHQARQSGECKRSQPAFCVPLNPVEAPQRKPTVPYPLHVTCDATAGASSAQVAAGRGFDLRAQTLVFLQQHFGKAGSYYYWAERRFDERSVRADRIRKSVGAANTFPADLVTYEAACDALREIVDKVSGYCERLGIRGRTVTLMVKFANFQQITRSRSGQMPIGSRSELEQLGNALLEPLFPVATGVTLLDISLSSLVAEEAEGKHEFSLSH